MKKKLGIFLAVVLIAVALLLLQRRTHFFNPFTYGQKIDSLHGVYVYYNGAVSNTRGRSRGKDGYNIGLRYQCVEFVKRYYYEYYHHKMPDPSGNAIDFFDRNLNDGAFNKDRGLNQFRNPSLSKPQSGDLMIFDATTTNRYGHVAIVARVEDDQVEIIQQNPGQYASSRATFDLKLEAGKYRIGNKRIMGWLRKISPL